MYMQKRSPHWVLEGMTLEELFTRVKLDVSYLCLFGSLIYALFPTLKRTKLETLSERGVFVAYNEVSKAYQVNILGQRKVILS